MWLVGGQMTMYASWLLCRRPGSRHTRGPLLRLPTYLSCLHCLLSNKAKKAKQSIKKFFLL